MVTVKKPYSDLTIKKVVKKSKKNDNYILNAMLYITYNTYNKWFNKYLLQYYHNMYNYSSLSKDRCNTNRKRWIFQKILKLKSCYKFFLKNCKTKTRLLCSQILRDGSLPLWKLIQYHIFSFYRKLFVIH
jgi:hypothetical protein